MDTLAKATTETLGDLVLLNNDRCEGYEKAMNQTDEADLKQLFQHLSDESRKFSSELKGLFPAGEEVPENKETTNSGKLYRVWMDVKNALTTNDRKSVLSSCEYGEDVIKKAYEEALKHREDLSSEVLSVLERQYSVLLEAHNRVKHLRDSAKK